MEIKNIIIVVLILILVSIVGVYAYGKVSDNFYQQGLEDAVLLINRQILDNLNQNGYVPYIIPINESTSYRIKLIPYQET